MRKIFALLLALVMVMGLATTAFADGNDGTITITNAAEGEDYAVYKVFDLSYTKETGADGKDVYKVAYTYTKQGESDALYAALNGEGSPFALEPTGDTGVFSVSTEETDGAVLAAWLKTQADADNLTVTAEQKGVTGNTVTFTGLGYGYYYVTSTLGTVVTVDSTLKDVEVQDKNVAPTAVKQVLDGETWGAENTASIGDTVRYKVTVTLQKGAKSYVLHDQMEAGLTFDGEVTLTDENENEVTDYELNIGELGDDCTFEVVFDQTYLDGIKEATTVDITYSATLNGQASTTEGNTNTVTLSYGNKGETTPSSVKTYTYGFDLVKYEIPVGGTDKKLLNGAKFMLYTVETEGTPINLVPVGANTYRVAEAADDEENLVTEFTAGKVTVIGLGNGTYWLEETEAPAGYNKIAGRQKVEIEKNLKAVMDEENPEIYVKDGVGVLNSTGSELPSTGGMGTTVFYILGSLMMAAAAVVLITKKRIA